MMHISTYDKDANATIVAPDKIDQQIVGGTFNLPDLNMFSKCARLSRLVEIYMNNESPLIIIYSVEPLGRIVACFSHITT